VDTSLHHGFDDFFVVVSFSRRTLLHGVSKWRNTNLEYKRKLKKIPWVFVLVNICAEQFVVDIEF
jgi:hypothetical protein